MKTHPLFPLFFITLLFVSACSKPEEKDIVEAKIYTLQLNDITNTEATLRLNYKVNKGEIKSLGFEWKKMSESHFNIVNVNVNPGISSFTIKDLEEDTKYEVKAFMVFPSGDTACGDTISFFTHGTVTDIDGNVYLTMRYEGKDNNGIPFSITWMTNNLRVTRYADGTPLEARTGGIGTFKDGPVYYHSVHHTTQLRNPNYGLLYNWAAAVRADRGDTLIYFEASKKVQGICPNGWHIPAVQELSSITLLYKGYEMKAGNWGGEGQLASNNYSQFSAEPAGFLNYYTTLNVMFRMIGNGAYFWTIDQSFPPTNAWSYNLYSKKDTLYIEKIFKTAGYSIRCVKDY